MSNTYFSLDLRRHLRIRSRYISLAITRSGTCTDLPGLGRGHSGMSDREDDGPAARNALGGRARRSADREDDRHRPWRKSDFPSDDAAFERCRVLSHMKTFLATSTAYSWSSESSFVGF